ARRRQDPLRRLHDRREGHRAGLGRAPPRRRFTQKAPWRSGLRGARGVSPRAWTRAPRSVMCSRLARVRLLKLSGPRPFAISATLFAVLLFAGTSLAMPQANILRIDPRAGIQNGQPILTSVIELVEFKPMSEVITNAGCGAAKGEAVLDCISNAVEQKNVM